MRKIKRKLTEAEYGNGITSATPMVKGMFFFSATGPAGAVCNMCVHAVNAELATAKKARCQRTLDYTKGNAPAFPYDVPAYKYFQRRQQPLFVTAAQHFYGAK